MLVGWRLLQLLHAEDIGSVLQGAELATVVGDHDLFDAFFREALWMPDWPARRQVKGVPWHRLELRPGLRGHLKQRPLEQVGLLALLGVAPAESREAARLRAQPAHIRPTVQSEGLSWLTLPNLTSLCLFDWKQPCAVPPMKTLFVDTLDWALPDTLEHLVVRRAADVSGLLRDCPGLKQLEIRNARFSTLPPLPSGLEQIRVGGDLRDASSLNALPALVKVELAPKVRGWPPDRDGEEPLPTATLAETQQLLEDLVAREELVLCGSLDVLALELQEPLGGIVDRHGREPGPHLSAWLLDHRLVDDLFITDEALSWRVRRKLVLGV